MFDIGFQELVLIFIVALLVFGPEKLPEIGRTLGRWMIELRKGIQNAKVQMESEFQELEKKHSAAAGENSGKEGQGEAQDADAGSRHEPPPASGAESETPEREGKG